MLLSLAKQLATDSAGQVVANAKLYLYQAGTTTTFVSYQDGAFTTPHAQPIEANGSGVLPAIHINPASATNHRQVLKTEAGATIYDEDNLPSNPSFLNSLVPLTDGTSDLGSVSPLQRWRDLILSSSVKIKTGSYTQTLSPATLTANRQITFPDSDVLIGGTTINSQSVDYTLVVGDIGKTIYYPGSVTKTVTIPQSVFPVGAIVEIENGSTGIITVTPASGVTLYRNGISGSVSLCFGNRLRLKHNALNIWADGAEEYKGSFTGTLTGMTASTTGIVTYRKIENLAFLYVQTSIQGTSNTTDMTMTGLPSALQTLTATLRYVPCMLKDNGANSFGWATVSLSGTISFGLGTAGSNFTSSGTKGLPEGCLISYPL
jgi:hypothetical protein